MRLKNFKETTSLAWSAIKSFPLRTILTSLIISFGIMALVGILSATDALKQSLESNFTSLGANTLTIRNSQGGFFVGNADYRQNPQITYREALRFKERMDYPGAKTSLTYIASGTAKLSYQNEYQPKYTHYRDGRKLHVHRRLRSCRREKLHQR